MPSITLNKEVFEGLVGKKLPLDELKDRISYLGTDLESIEGNEIVVEVFPNRPDMLSEQGFGRAFSSFIGVKKGLSKFVVKKSSYRVKIDESVKKIRPYIACAVVKNLKFDDEKIKEIIQIQEKLHVTYGRNRKKAAIGIYPFEKITMPIYYKALKPEEIKFRPLESEKEMTGLQILSQHHAGREYGYLLEGKESFPVFVDANNQVLSMPPIINSHETGKISSETRDVFIECSGFDLETQNILLNIIVTALSDMGGEIYSMELFYPDRHIITPDLKPRQMRIDLGYVNKLLGLELKEDELKELLERMGYSYYNKMVSIPAYRADVLHAVDLIEDIAIAYGYENFKADIPNVSTIGQEHYLEPFKGKLREILIGLGLLETSSYHITSKENVENCKRKVFVEIENPLSAEYSVMRSTLIPCTLGVFSENQHHEYPQKVFEIGIVFSDKDEREKLVIGICHDKANFTGIKQMLDGIFSSLGLEYSLNVVKDGCFIEGRVGGIISKGEILGVIGEVKPGVLADFHLAVPVSLLEIDLELLYKLVH